MLAPLPYSPDVDVFSTPPTTPMTSEFATESLLRPSLTRAVSRPSTLHISQTATSFKPDILLDTQSPHNLPSSKSPPSPHLFSNGNGHTPTDYRPSPSQHMNDSDHASETLAATVATRTEPDSTAELLPRSPHTYSQSLTMSPCFVHSNLDKGASFSEWLNTSNGLPPINVARALQPTSPHKSPSRRYRKLDNGQVIVIPYEDEEHEHVFDVSDYEDDDGNGSLTKRLAETAVGVREMSKQLGAFSGRYCSFPLKPSTGA